MANEKQINPINWKERLSDLHNVAGETVDKDAAWDRLQNRLHEKPANNKTAWYWVAAGLIVLVIIPFVMGKRSENLPATPVVRQKHTPLPTQPAAEALRQTEARPVIIVAAPVNPPSHQPVAANRLRRRRPPNNQPIALVVDKPAGQGRLAIIQLVPPTDTAVLLVTGVPIKKKLPVVHINELGKQEQENAKFANHADLKALQIKWLAQENYRANTLPPGSTDRDLLNIKIPLKN